jgi:hypothetical protein
MSGCCEELSDLSRPKIPAIERALDMIDPCDECVKFEKCPEEQQCAAKVRHEIIIRKLWRQKI